MKKSLPGVPLLAIVSVLTAMFGVGSAQAAAAPDPGDYTGLPAGTNLVVLYGQGLRADDVYASGNKVVNNLGLKVDLGLFRYVHYMKVGDYILDPQVIVPFGRQKVGLTGDRTSGIGDIIAGATLWTIADLKSGEHLGFTGFLTLPTGNDKNNGYALSNNRYALDLQAGYIRKLSDQWTIDLIAQTELYGKQRDTDAKKDPLYRGYVHLRYHTSPSTHIAASYRHSWGAKESLNGTTLAGKQSDGNVGFTLASFVNKQTQLQVQYFTDTKVRNGPKIEQLNLRMLYLY